MAAFSTTITAAMSNLSMGFSQRTSVAFPQKVSRVSFTTSATNNSDQTVDDLAAKAKEQIKVTSDKGEEVAQQIKDAAASVSERAKDDTEKVKKAAEDAYAEGKEKAEKVKDAVVDG